MLVESISERELALELTQSTRRPQTRLEGVRADPDLLFRIVVGNTVQLWVWVDDWWDDFVFVRPRAVRWAPVIEPIAASEVRSVENWLWFMRERLAASSLNPMYAVARFRLERAVIKHNYSESRHKMLLGAVTEQSVGMPAPPNTLNLGASQASFWEESWNCGPQVVGGLLPLRTLTRSDEGRLKWWRKVARAGALPPLLIWYVQVLERYVVLDGHLRLQAALAEGVDVPVVRLWQEGSSPPTPKDKRDALERGVAQLLASTPQAVSKANSMLRLAYDGCRFAKQRGWRVRGGAREWFMSMREALPDPKELPDWVPKWLADLEQQTSRV